MERFEVKQLSCDVLCVGGSGAAVSAAWTAARQGKQVILVSKGRTGRSGNALMVGGGFGIDGYQSRCILGEAQADESFGPDQLVEKIVKSSFYLGDQRLARQFVEDAPVMMKEFLTWAKEARQNFTFVKSGLYAVSGSGVGKAIQQGVREIPSLTVLDDTAAVDLLTQDGCVHGALCYELYTGNYVAITAKSTVLATGGYQPHSLKNSISDMTGDGMAMALRAGARISDMEFLLYIPTAVSPPYLKGSILPYLFTIPIFMPLSFKVRDTSGRELSLPDMFSKVPGSNKMLKLIYSYCWTGQGTSNEGIRGGLYYDYSEHSDEEICAAFEHFIDHYGRWHRRGTYNGVDLYRLRDDILRTRRLEFALGNEYSNGGVVVDERMATDVPGLFAAGEVTSGLFGAFRAGDGLTEMLAHGYRAGLSAAEFAGQAGLLPDLSQRTDSLVEALEQVRARKGGPRSVTLLRRLEQTADEGMGVVRDARRMERALATLDELEAELARVAIPGGSRAYDLDFFDYLTLRNLLPCTRAGLTAALMRRESRGTHIRSDIPQVYNSLYFYRITHRLAEGRLVQGKIVPAPGPLAPPTEDYDTVAAYLAQLL